MLFLIIIVFALPVIGWLSYYTSASVYKSLKKDNNKYASLIQVLVALATFVLLSVLIGFLILSNIHLER